MKKFVHENLNKEWLYQKYIIENLTCKEIGDLIGCERHRISRDLKFYGIEIRKAIEASLNKYKRRFINNKEIIDGIILGDGCLWKTERFNGATQLIISQINKDLVEYIRDSVAPDCKVYMRPGRPYLYKNETLYGKDAYKIQISSLDLNDYFYRWYKNKIKVVPKDLVITPTLVLHWFCGDGSTSYLSGRNRSRLVLCTHGFSHEEVIFLQRVMKNVCNLGIYKSNKIKKNGEFGYYLASINTEEIRKFFNYIGPCPKEVPSLEYKWKVPYYTRSWLLNKNIIE